MQKTKMYRSGAAFTEIGETGENGGFCRSQLVQPVGLSTEFLGFGSEQFENYRTISHFILDLFYVSITN